MLLIAALEAFHTEYGRWPQEASGSVFRDEASQAKVLNALQAIDISDNPRKIVFFESRRARRFSGSEQKTQYALGVSPDTGALLDPWGNPYQIITDADHDNLIASPYADEDDIHLGAIVWSLGEDGQHGCSRKPGYRKCPDGRVCDDIRSWQ